MNRLTIIGNLTRDPELRTTADGISVCSFSVAVNKPKRNGKDQEADFFNVSAWRELGENCAKYLAKGRKVCVIGPVAVRLFTRNDGSTGASLEVQAREVEFLSSKSDGDQDYHSAEAQPQAPQPQASAPEGFTEVEPPQEMPF